MLIVVVNLFILEVMLLFMSKNYLFYNSNNSVDINLMECVEKEKFAFDKLDSTGSQAVDTDSKYDKEIQAYAIKKVLRKK